jgi:phosphoenolpyruvate carboxylase
MTRLPPAITQNADVRFLGKLLGDVMRRHGGDALFQRIEAIRAASVDRHRGIANPRGLAAGWETLTLDETVAFVRSFMLFSMLANLAEDRQGTSAEEGSSLASALQLLHAQGIHAGRITSFLERALVTPVLTAHPTEVMRKSMLDHRNRIALLMRQRDAGHAETPDGEVIEEAITAQIALLWQTRALRRERLYVSDEVDTALTYLKDIFLPVVPAPGQLDWRRSRRKSARHRRFAAPGLGQGGAMPARRVPRTAQCLGRRAVGVE